MLNMKQIKYNCNVNRKSTFDKTNDIKDVLRLCKHIVNNNGNLLVFPKYIKE